MKLVAKLNYEVVEEAYVYTSEDIPGLFVTSKNKEQAIARLYPVIRRLVNYNLGFDCLVDLGISMNGDDLKVEYAILNRINDEKAKRIKIFLNNQYQYLDPFHLSLTEIKRVNQWLNKVVVWKEEQRNHSNRIKRGIDYARKQGVQLGRPKISLTLENKIKKHLKKGNGILKTAKHFKVGTGTVQRIKDTILYIAGR